MLYLLSENLQPEAMKTVYCYQHGFLHIGLNLTQLYLNRMRWTVHLKLFFFFVFFLSRNSISHFLLFLGFLCEKYQTNQCLFFIFYFFFLCQLTKLVMSCQLMDRVNEAVRTCWLTEVCLTAFIYMEIVVVYIFVRLKIQMQTKVWPHTHAQNSNLFHSIR